MIVQKSSLGAADFVFIPVFQITGIYTYIPAPPPLTPSPAGFKKDETAESKTKSLLITDKFPA
jgi:hypothetical protein